MRPENPVDAEVEITIVVSCYNEEGFITDTIENVIQALKATGHTFEIIVVDDVSRDNSVQKVRDYMRTHPEHPIRLVQNKVNRGLANNYIEAAFLGRGKYYRLCCGDDSESPEALVNIFRQIGVADIVVPCQNQDEIVGKSAGRRLLSKTFTFLVNLISGYHIQYYNGMAVHLRHNVLRWHPSSYGFGFQADILTRLLDEGASFVQVRSFGADRKGGGSTALTTRNLLSVGHTLLELSIRRLRRLLYGRSMPRPVERPAIPPAPQRSSPGVSPS
ncbi:MAG: glycosyltransferase family 2 protein [Verrucomicrobiota bacterium]|jgi:glycosyltransferase involved in cell wall biosynthesis